MSVKSTTLSSNFRLVCCCELRGLPKFWQGISERSLSQKPDNGLEEIHDMQFARKIHVHVLNKHGHNRKKTFEFKYIVI